MRTHHRPLSWQYSALARAVHGVIALLSAAGLVTSLYLGWTNGSQLPAGVGYTGGFSAGWEHMLNQPAYFTFLSGLLVFITTGLLALNPQRDSRLFHCVRLAGVVQMIITGLVFNLLLRTEDQLEGVWFFNDMVLHVIVPIAAPVVWLILGPHGRLSPWVVFGSMVIPLAWLMATLIRGPGLDWYPYNILDVPGMGYPGVGVYIGSILVAFLGIATALWLVDRKVARP